MDVNVDDVSNRSVLPPNPDVTAPPIIASNIGSLPLNAGSVASLPPDAGLSNAMTLNTDDSGILVPLQNKDVKTSSESADLNNETESQTMDVSVEPEEEPVHKATPSNRGTTVVFKNNAVPSNSTVEEVSFLAL